MNTAFFNTTDNEWFEPTDPSRGPWHPEYCHAGPPTGLIARAMERVLLQEADDRVAAQQVRLTRITVNLHRPIPFQGFRVEAGVQRAGRTVSCTTGRILNAEGQECATAQGLHMRRQPDCAYPTHHQFMGSPQQATPGAFPIESTVHNLPAFHQSVETRYPQGQDGEPGPTTLWLRTVPLLPNETPSPFQRICALADSGNAIGRNAEIDQVSFVNADLTIALQRDPQGDWMGSQAAGYWEPTGIGLADALLFDQMGVVGRALQCVLLQPV